MKVIAHSLLALASLYTVAAAPSSLGSFDILIDGVSAASSSSSIVARNAQSNKIIATDQAGGSHGGDVWDDSEVFARKSNLRIGEIQMWCNQKNQGELQAVGFGFRDNANTAVGMYNYKIHGTNASPPLTQSWTLGTDEYVTTINAYTYKARGHTRIGSLVFNTNKRAGLASCGPKTGTKVMLGSPDWALLYTSGNSGRVVDFMQAHWIDSATF